ncbi:hypothetical protein [Burkholderia gladioli]|uniref:hypothetical protein n=1 Tax=Burkholderia gladioli TaxID=28095 RepID=UPI000BF2412C|nr:hypothetical protein [Burkholderia gladioli]PEH80365.1 hypothetical protein CRM95_36000 [Burkholderia gladioli]
MQRITTARPAERDRAPSVTWLAGRPAVILAVLAPLGHDHAFLGLMLASAYALMLRAAGFPRGFD